MPHEIKIKGHLAMAIAIVLFSLISPIGKSILEYISPLSLNVFRLSGAAICFWVTSFFLPKEDISWTDIRKLFFAALFGTMLNQGLFIIGLSMTSPIDSSIITTAVPLLTMIVAAFYLKEPITSRKVIGVLIGAIGAIILILGGSQIANGQSSLLGNCLCLLAQLSYAIYLTVFKDLVTKYSPVTISKWIFSYALLCYFPISCPYLINDHLLSLPSTIWIRIISIAVFSTFVSFFLMMTAQKILRPTVISTYNYLLPLVGSSLSVMMGLASFTWVSILAAIFIFSGVYIVTLSKKREY